MSVEDSRRFRISVDTGGTFTDIVVGSEQGVLAVGKALTTRQRISSGMLEALGIAAAALDLDVAGLLGRTRIFIYASTRATNAILENKTAKTALLVSSGFPDILVRREGGKANPWDFSQPFPAPYVPRNLTFEISERITAEGEVLTPLDEAQVSVVAQQLQRRGVEAVAVCLLWSISNAAHELAVARILDALLPGVPYTLSHRLNPIVREYRRASSAAIDASLKPLMQSHLAQMQEDLRAAGFKGELLPATSLGGVMHMQDVIERPIHMVRSGPALAPVLGLVLGQAEAGAQDVIVCDTGGTSFDVSLVRGGRPVFSRETWLGGKYVGHQTGLSSIDARSIGSGGGSIAWVDAGGLLKVGPQSAGAEPGPACYGRGGLHATVTDAALVLGYLDAEYFLGGRMRLDVAAARRVVAALGESMGQSAEEIAQGILTIASEHMVEAIKEITINEGVDPRESLLMAGGGAAGLNIVPIAQALGCTQVLLPRMAGALSACGAQYSDIVTEFSVNAVTSAGRFDFDAINAALRNVQARIQDFEGGVRSRGIDAFRTDYFVEARYLNQVWELEIPLQKGHFDGEADVQALTADFHRSHESIFAVADLSSEVEFIQWKGRATAQLQRPPLDKQPLATHTAKPLRHVRACFEFVGAVEVPVYRGDSLLPGMSIAGPALIIEPTTTLVVYPHSAAVVTALNNYMISVPQTAEQASHHG